MRHTMEIMDGSGHRTIEWREGNTVQEEKTRGEFAQLIAQGYRAVAPGKSDGESARFLKEFDPREDTLMLAPMQGG